MNFISEFICIACNVKSWDGILESPEKSMVICDYSLQKCNSLEPITPIKETLDITKKNDSKRMRKFVEI